VKVRANQVYKVVCDDCGKKVEDQHLESLHWECELWERIDRCNYCETCKRSARLAKGASQEDMIKQGEKAFQAGGQEWADWNARALDLGD
jgi:hypothetical protein